jgi:hypothetical protein
MSHTDYANVATGVCRKGYSYRAQWVEAETGAKRFRSGFATAQEAIDFRAEMLAGRTMRPRPRLDEQGEAFSLAEALSRAPRNAAGWAWAWGRTENGRRLVGCLEPDGQISVSLEVWSDSQKRNGHPEHLVPYELQVVNERAPVVLAARWRPAR